MPTYYKDGKVAVGLYNSELAEINGSVYLIKWSGKVAADETRFVPGSLTNGLVSADTYITKTVRLQSVFTTANWQRSTDPFTSLSGAVRLLRTKPVLFPAP